MPTLNFTTFQGSVPRCQHYALSEYLDILYIVPDDTKTARRYDPFDDMDGLLLDVIRAGAAVASCDAFFEYGLERGMMPLQDSDLWRCGDFFLKHYDEARPVVDTILAFVERYGLPAWEAQSITSTYYPARYEREMMNLHREDGGEDMFSLVQYESVKRACQKSGSVPVFVVALILLGFYLQFMEGVGEKQFFIRSADWMMDWHEKTPGLTAQVYDLTACIRLAYTLLVSGEGRAVRQCKHCGKFFIADDLRAEYCSPQCRGAYNSKMTRKRVKERKLREGQQIKNEGG